jgi:hypothetical protein
MNMQVMCSRSCVVALTVLLLLGCRVTSWKKETLGYRVVANPDQFSPPLHVGVRAWRFDASPAFDARDKQKLREYVNDALKQLELPPVATEGEPAGGFTEGAGAGRFIWSVFEWKDYERGSLQVRVGARTETQQSNRVVFIFLDKKP